MNKETALWGVFFSVTFGFAITGIVSAYFEWSPITLAIPSLIAIYFAYYTD